MSKIERKEREKQLRRESILDAAESVFFEKGLIASTMDEIAEKAELSKGTLYLYYRSKDDLYLGVICRGFDILIIKLIESVSPNVSTIQKLLNIGSAYYNFSQKHTHYFRMFSFLESPQFHTMASEELLNESHNQSKRAWDVIIDVISNGIKDGTFRENIDPVQMAIILWSNATAIMKLKDRKDQFWIENLNVDVDTILQKSNAMLVSTMLTENAKRYYQPKL